MKASRTLNRKVRAIFSNIIREIAVIAVILLNILTAQCTNNFLIMRKIVKHLILQKSVYYAEANGNMTTHIPRPSARIASLRHARESFKNSNFYGIVKAVGLIVLANLSPS